MPQLAEWDVAVIGSGPAGLAAARASALAGARTVVLERSAHPRYKTCGGGLIGASLSAIEGTRIRVRDEIAATTFTLDGRREFTRTAGGPILSMVMRDEFDDILRREAEADGAVVLQRSAVRAVSQDTGQARARLADGTTVGAQVIVGADGSSGVTAKHVGFEASQVDLGLEVEIDASESLRENWRHRLLIDWGPIPGSYGWIFPKQDRLTVGVIASRGFGDETRKYLSDLLERHRLSSRKRLRDSGHLTRCRADTSPLRKGRVLLAGDAAGLLEPWTREGISFALRSGALAGATAAAAAAKSGHSSQEQALQQYQELINAALIPEMLAGTRLLAAFSRHPAALHLGLATPGGWRVFVEYCRSETPLASLLRHSSVRLALAVLSRA